MLSSAPEYLTKFKKIKQDLAELESDLSQPDVVSDPARYKKLNQDHARNSALLEKFNLYFNLRDQYQQACEVRDNENDGEMKELAAAEADELESKVNAADEELSLALMPRDPNSGCDIIVEIRAGTGGDEAALFAGDLFRMYSRFAESEGMKVEIITKDQTGIGGYKEITLSISGERAYDLFIGEGGGHRVQRIPTTESGGRIHTSAATVAVMAEVEEADVDIKEADLRIDVYRSSGAGGQHVNTTDSAVRITHIPTGVVVTSQDERSQIKNRANAMRVLRSRILEAQEEEAHAKMASDKKAQVGSGDRSQRIRTYNFPQNRITDHRNGFTSYSLDQLMEGNIEAMLLSVMKYRKEQAINNEDQE